MPRLKPQATAYADWLAAEIREAVNDPRPNLAHDAVMAEMEAGLAAKDFHEVAR